MRRNQKYQLFVESFSLHWITNWMIYTDSNGLLCFKRLTYVSLRNPQCLDRISLPKIKILEFQLIFWCKNFVEHNFRWVSENSLKTQWNLPFAQKFHHQGNRCEVTQCIQKYLHSVKRFLSCCIICTLLNELQPGE